MKTVTVGYMREMLTLVEDDTRITYCWGSPSVLAERDEAREVARRLVTDAWTAHWDLSDEMKLKYPWLRSTPPPDAPSDAADLKESVPPAATVNKLSYVELCRRVAAIERILGALARHIALEREQ